MRFHISLAVLVIFAVLSTTFAGDGKRRRRGCSEWSKEECVPKKGVCGKGRHKGTRSGDNCELTEKMFRCIVPCPEGVAEVRGGCRYEKGSDSRWGECDVASNTMSMEKVLSQGSPAGCEPTKTATRPCRSGKKGKDKRQRGCRYEKGEWTECDPSGVKTRVDTLRDGARDGCPQQRTKTRQCAGSS